MEYYIKSAEYFGWFYIYHKIWEQTGFIAKIKVNITKQIELHSHNSGTLFSNNKTYLKIASSDAYLNIKER